MGGICFAIKEVANFRTEAYMLNWLNCYLSGRHDFGVTCSSGSIFLRCIHCGKRSNGWAVHNEQAALVTVPARIPRQQGARPARPLPFLPRETPQRRSA
jgi:hypothetical protein